MQMEMQNEELGFFSRILNEHSAYLLDEVIFLLGMFERMNILKYSSFPFREFLIFM